MRTPAPAYFSELSPDDVIKTQALVVTAGPFAGRVCENDDDELLFRSDLSPSELQWMEHAGLVWRHLEEAAIEEANAEGFETAVDELVVDCEVITFGFYLSCPGYHFIPRQFLRPATMEDLIDRHDTINNLIMRAAFTPGRAGISHKKLNDLLLEQAFIANEIQRRDEAAKTIGGPHTLFLCHASADKPAVRRVHADLAAAGQSAWMDEFEIKVGDSIVGKIDEATTNADALVLFLSKSAISSEWVRREWRSSLARSLSGASIQVLPVLLEECGLPSIIADIKYADFSKSYHSGLRELLQAVSNLSSAARKP